MATFSTMRARLILLALPAVAIAIDSGCEQRDLAVGQAEAHALDLAEKEAYILSLN